MGEGRRRPGAGDGLAGSALPSAAEYCSAEGTEEAAEELGKCFPSKAGSRCKGHRDGVFLLCPSEASQLHPDSLQLGGTWVHLPYHPKHFWKLVSWCRQKPLMPFLIFQI